MATIQFYPIDIDYVTTQFGKAVIRLFGRTTDGKRICCLDRKFEPYFYAELEEDKDEKQIIAKIKECKEHDSFVTNIELDNKKRHGNGVFLKVYVNHPQDVPAISEMAREIKGLKGVNESDILFVRRYLIDKGIMPLQLCNASGSLLKDEIDVDIVIDAEEINTCTESTNELRVLSFDIETYSKENHYSNSKHDPIISIAFYGHDFKKIITWKKTETEMPVYFAKNESELITEFARTIKEYKPDCIIGYFTDGFDFPYIIERAKIYGIKLNIGLDNSQIKTSKRGAGNIKITGIVHIDLLKFIKNIIGASLQVENYSLNEVSYALIKERKSEFNVEKIGLVWDSNSNEINKIIEYNLRDAEITYKLFQKISFDVYELTKLIGQPIDDVTRMHYGQLVEWYLIRKAKEFNELIPNKPRFGEKSERLMHTYQGAFVYQPKPGLYENLVVFDFRSLYPSIIIAHNIDPSMLTKEKDFSHESPELIDESGKGVHYYFSYKEPGFIPTVLKDLISRRARIKEMIKKEKNDDNILEARSYMLKIIANATYGMFGFSGARWYSRECAAAITSYGRFYMIKVVDKAKERFDVIYGDTDSCIMLMGKRSKQEALNFMNEINETLPPFMELELENFYDGGMFVMKKNEAQGAKKKYVLIDEHGKLKIRGFETVRRDWSYLAREVQLKVMEIILKEKSIEKAKDYVKKVIDDLREKKIPLNKMIIKTQLRKEIKNYDSIGPHVKVAKKMNVNGQMAGIGTIISYVITEGKGIIGDRAKLPDECKPDEYDAEYYINNQIIPAVKMIFEAVGYSKDILIESKEQSKLNSFFGDEK